MKKILIIIMTCLLLTGCDSFGIDKVASNLESSKNYNVDVSLEINGKFNDELIDYKREKNVKLDNINSSALVDAKVIQNKIEKEETYYIKSNSDMVTTYKKYNDYYESITESKDKNSIYYITAFINQNSVYQYMGKDQGIYHFVVTLNKDRVKDFISSYYDVEVLNGLDYEINDSAKINVYVNGKTKNITSLDVDFTSIIEFTNLETYELDRFFLEIKYSDFNSDISIIIPEDVIASSVDQSYIIAYEDAIKYVDMVNSLNLEDAVTTYTNTNLVYGGVTPQNVTLTIVKGKVISGSIKLSDIEYKVESGVVSSPHSTFENME